MWEKVESDRQEDFSFRNQAQEQGNFHTYNQVSLAGCSPPLGRKTKYFKDLSDRNALHQMKVALT